MMLALLTTLALAAAPAEHPSPDATRPSAAWTLSAGWLGELVTHPGVFAGAERPLIAGRHHALLAGGRVGLYVHPRHHVGLWVRPELGYRATAGFGLYGEVLAGVGLHHRWLAGTVYVEREGELRRVVDGGRPTAMPGAAIGLGWDLDRRGELPLRLFGRLDGWGRAPVNGALTPGLALSLGFAWTLGGGR